MHELVLLRHGESTWNESRRFAGWTDVDLTPRGVRQAEDAARVLKAEGYVFDLAFTSLLNRAVRTLSIVLKGMDLGKLPVHRDWRLNERHFGALQGLSMTEAVARYGSEKVMLWRSGRVAPPPLDEDDERHPKHDPRYAGISASELPIGESVPDASARLLPFWRESVVPALCAGRRVLIVAHGNILRALLQLLDGLPDDAVFAMNVPNAIPLAYRLDVELKPVRRAFLGDPAAVRRALEAVARQAEGAGPGPLDPGQGADRPSSV
jgi:2,3-bisphosphoglycerate-dependent phosphoglycerate mutase